VSESELHNAPSPDRQSHRPLHAQECANYFAARDTTQPDQKGL
jgi:hypothetical protein